MESVTKELRGGKSAIFGKITDRMGNPIKDAIIVIEGKWDVKGRVYRKVCGIVKTDGNGEYLFFVANKRLNYKINVFEDRYHTVNDVIRFIKR